MQKHETKLMKDDKLTEKGLDHVKEYLEKNQCHCPSCSIRYLEDMSHNFHILDLVYQLEWEKGFGVLHIHPPIPTIVVVCNLCAGMSFFAATRMGFYKKEMEENRKNLKHKLKDD